MPVRSNGYISLFPRFCFPSQNSLLKYSKSPSFNHLLHKFLSEPPLNRLCVYSPSTHQKMNNLMTKSFLDCVDLKNQALKDEAINLTPDLESGGLTAVEEDNLSLFFQEVAAISSEMDGISDLLLDLRRLHQESKATHSPKLLRGITDRMDSDMIAVLRKANFVKLRLKFLDDFNFGNRQVSPAFFEGGTVDRTRISITAGIRNKLRGMMNEFHELREQIVVDHREGLRRRYFSATGELATDEVLDRIVSVRSVPGCDVGLILSEKNDELSLEVEERRRAVEDIQRSLNRLHGIFLDMAVVVEKQGEELNDIEGNVAGAKSFIGGGTGRLSAAFAKRKRRREGRLCFCAVAAAVLFVFLILSFVE